MKHVYKLLGFSVFWILAYFVFAFLEWNVWLIKDMINAIPEKESARFVFLAFLAVNIFVYKSLDSK